MKISSCNNRLKKEITASTRSLMEMFESMDVALRESRE
jgi:hypothetical protein